MEFTTQGIHPKLPAGIHISSMKQWEKVQKRYGVTADLSLRERMERKRSGVAQKLSRERREHLKEKLRPVVEQAFRQQHQVQLAR